ncbi:MAG: hypothetical protein JW915_15670 [Chitinispirillaceae bacterium]|nr:hypothetical protein [Chitinispirillaceae bacterium]
MIKSRCAGILIFSMCFCFNSLVSCSSKVQLHLDSQSPYSTPVENVAKLNCAGISVIVETGVWYGRENDGKEIVPIRITFSNNSGFPIVIRYSDFFIAGSKSGDVYPALPPYYFKNDEEIRKIVLPGIVASEPYFDCEKFSVAYYSAGMYPTLPIWKGVFLHDHLYYNLYYPLWARKKLDSFTSLIKSEIPEGVLLDGGFLSGFIYFETLSKKEKKVSLHFRICEARRGKVLETISIPFAVKD